MTVKCILSISRVQLTINKIFFSTFSISYFPLHPLNKRLTYLNSHTSFPFWVTLHQNFLLVKRRSVVKRTRKWSTLLRRPGNHCSCELLRKNKTSRTLYLQSSWEAFKINLFAILAEVSTKECFLFLLLLFLRF